MMDLRSIRDIIRNFLLYKHLIKVYILEDNLQPIAFKREPEGKWLGWELGDIIEMDKTEAKQLQ